MSLAEPLVSRNGWLWWKEFRMLAPLVGMLIAVAVLLLIVTVLFADSNYAISYNIGLKLFIPLVFPALFAAGAGAVMVGQEREQRTVDWMTTLPMSPRQWISVKVFVAMTGLGVMWVLAAFCLMLLGNPPNTGTRWRIGGVPGMMGVQVGYPLWIVHSIYLTLCGFYTSWRIKNQFHAIIAVLVLACLPLATSELYRSLIWSVRSLRLSASHVHAVTFTVTCILIPIFAVLAYRAAMRALLPQSAADVVKHRTEPRSVASSFWSTAPLMGSSSASMIWQSIRSAPVALTLTIAISLTGFMLPLLLTGSETLHLNEFYLATSVLLLPLGMSWLGVLVFQNDGSAERLRFLADRGVSPTRVYLSRHAVPLAALATCLILYVIVASGRMSRLENDPLRPIIPSLLTLSMIGWVMYSISQWTSQLFRTLVLSVIVSPIVALLALGWYAFAITALRTPLWMVAICSLLPGIATWWLMPRFMDMRDRPRSFIVAVGIVATTIAVPVGAAAWRVTRVPRMATSVRNELLAEGQKLRQSQPTRVPIKLVYPNFPYDYRDASPDRVRQWLEDYPATPTDWIPALAELRDEPNSAGSMDGSVHSVFNRLMFERMRFQRTNDWETFSPWVIAASEMAASLRRSRHWADQERADVIEIWIVDTLRRPSIDPHRSDQVYTQVVGNLSSKSSRNSRRRDAVLATWASYGHQIIERDLIQDRGLQWQPPYLAPWMKMRRIESIVATAISALRGDDKEWLRRMHDLQVIPGIPLEYGPYGPRIRQLPAIALIRFSTPLLPARFWGMAWEDQAEQLMGGISS